MLDRDVRKFHKEDNENARHDQIRLRGARYYKSDHLDRLTHPTKPSGYIPNGRSANLPHLVLPRFKGKHKNYLKKERETDRQKTTSVLTKFLITHPVE
jgi:hypothetical protein